MDYILEDKNEFTRLEEQEKIQCYNISNDLPLLGIKPQDIILDAGCGAGTISRYISTNFPLAKIEGCDASADRLAQADTENKKRNLKNITVFESRLDQLTKPDNSYDKIVCRFVYEYLATPQQVTNEFYRVTKPGGKACLIDLDGVFFNLQTQNSFVNDCLEKMKNAFSTPEFYLDLFVGRKLLSFMKEAGFKNIEYQTRVMEFKGEDILKEIENYKERFVFSHKTFSQILGEETATKFEKEYLEELNRPENIFFYNIFTVVGEK